MGSVNLDNTGSGSAITLSSDGTSLLLNGTAVGGGSANAVPTTTVPVSGQTNNWTVAIGQNVLINVDNNKSSNVGIGYGALELAEDVRTNVAVGGNALRNNGTASFAWQNTAIGVSAGSNVTGGTNNIFMGYNCGGAISGGGQNIIIGAEAYLNKTGSNFQNNVIIGYKAGSGSTQTSPNDQILIGQQAGYNATSGAIAIGNFAVSGNGGFQSVGIGHRALNSGGYIRNTAVGHYCMLNADQTAQENTAMGYYALKQLTTGDGNVAIGNQTALNITTGSYNTLVGNYAGDALTTPTANTFIGQNSGGNITTGSKNTIIGIFNGNQHGLDIRTSSNNIVLSDGDGNPRVIVDGSGNLLAGKTSSATNTVGHELKVNGTAVHTTDGITPFYLNRKTTDGVIAEFRKDNTTVGTIGVSGGNNLYISGEATNHSGVTFGTDVLIPSRQAAMTNGITDLGSSGNRFKDLYLSSNVYANNFMGVNDTNTFVHMGGSDVMSFWTGNNERMRIDSSGNVGIGTNNSVAKLAIKGANDTNFEIQPDISSGVNRITNFNRVSSTYKKLRIDASEHEFYVSGNPKVNIDSSGRVTMPSQPAFYASGGGGGITNGTIITNWVEKHDASNNHTNGRFTAPVAGYYAVSMGVRSINGSSTIYAQIHVNGGGALGLSAIEVKPSMATEHHRGGGYYYLNANDYVEVYAGSNVHTDGSDHFAVTLLS